MDTNSLNDLLAANLESLMEEKSLNASAWAKAAGMGHTGVRDIIKKKVKNPTYSTLLKLAEVAEVDVRRITVGPEFASVDSQDAALVDLAHQLTPELRLKLLAYGEGLLDAADPAPEQSR